MNLKSIRYCGATAIAVATLLHSGYAAAWKVDLHIWIAQQVVNDAADGELTLELDNSTFRVLIPPRIQQAITENPKDFLLGSIGPDAFPGAITGQTVIHPSTEGGWGTSEWLQHILQQGELTNKELAFVFGFFTHAASDVFAHTFVNRYSGDVFDLQNHPGAATRHIYVESLISNYIPALRNIRGKDLGSAADLVRENGKMEIPENLLQRVRLQKNVCVL